MKHLNFRFSRFEEIMTSVFLILTLLLLFIPIVTRTLHIEGIVWAEEASRLTFLFMVYLGSSMAAQKNGHIRITCQLRLFPDKLRKFMLLLADFIWCIFNIIVIVEGIKLVNAMADMPFTSGAAGWDLRWAFLIIPISFALQCFRIVEHHYKGLKYGYTDSISNGVVDDAS